MNKLQEFRQNYPQYNDMSDQQLADALHDKFYSDIPKDDYYQRIGLAPAAPPKPMTALQTIMQSAPVQGIIGASDALVNFPAKGINAGADLAGLPSQARLPLFKGGEGNAYDIGSKLGDIGSYFMGGEAADTARLLAENAPAIGKAAQFLGAPGVGGVTGRALGNAAFGGIQNNDDPSMGALSGTAASLATDAIPGSLKGLAKVAEIAKPEKFTNALVDSIANKYQEAKDVASSFFNPVMERFGNYHLTKNNPSKEYRAVDSKIIDQNYNQDLMKLHDDFTSRPTLQNAHDLQSQLGVEIRALQGANDAATRRSVVALKNAREALKTDMDSFLRIRSPEMADQYKEGSRYFAENVAPYRADNTVQKIAEGTRKTISPKQLNNVLTRVNESQDLDKSHYLAQALDALTNKLNVGQMVSSIGSMVGGAGLSELMNPGIGSALSGAAVGKFIGPSTLSLAQNPVAIGLAKALHKGYRPATNALKGALLSNESTR